MPDNSQAASPAPACPAPAEQAKPARPTIAALLAANAELAGDLARVRAALAPMAHARPFSPLAWTGGDSPRSVPPSRVPVPQAAYCRALFRQQCHTFRAAWGEAPAWDTFRIFYGRARGDSFATFRGAFNG